MNKKLFKQQAKKEQILKQNLSITKIKKSMVQSDYNLYSQQRSEIEGKDKLLLLHQIKEYKTLFPYEI